MDFSYICSECGRGFAIEPHLMVCPDCGPAQAPDQPLRGVLEVEVRGEVPADWEIASLLPVEPQFFPSIPVGEHHSGRRGDFGANWIAPGCTSRTTA